MRANLLHEVTCSAVTINRSAVVNFKMLHYPAAASTFQNLTYSFQNFRTKKKTSKLQKARKLNAVLVPWKKYILEI